MRETASDNAESTVAPENLLSKRARTVQVSIGIGALLLGVMVYVVDRSPGSAYFVPSWLSMSGYFSQSFGIIGNYLPTFVHPFAFILLTASLVEPKKRNLVFVCLLWFTTDSLFELAQMTAVAQWVVKILPEFTNMPVLENIQNYFMRGTFDVLDLLSIILGTTAAYLIVKRNYLYM